jgi:hypothetical protein
MKNENIKIIVGITIIRFFFKKTFNRIIIFLACIYGQKNFKKFFFGSRLCKFIIKFKMLKNESLRDDSNISKSIVSGKTI